eukprot:gene4872-5511_t
MKQNRPSVSKSSIKTPAFTRRDELSQSPFTVVGYKSELNRDHSNSQVTGAYTTATTTDASVIAAASAIDEQSYCSKSLIFNRARIVKPGSNGAIPRWRAKPFHLSNQYNHPDPMLTAGKQFMNRITQLSLLQSDTIKYENSRRKVKKSQLVQKTLIVLVILGYVLDVRLYLYIGRNGNGNSTSSYYSIIPAPRRFNWVGTVVNSVEKPKVPDQLREPDQSKVSGRLRVAEKLLASLRKKEKDFGNSVGKTKGDQYDGRHAKLYHDGMKLMTAAHKLSRVGNATANTTATIATGNELSEATAMPSATIEAGTATSIFKATMAKAKTRTRLSSSDDKRRADTAVNNSLLLYGDQIVKASKPPNVDLVILVLTAASKFQRRRNIRSTWWKECVNESRVACWFFTDRIDSISDENIRTAIEQEQSEHGDIIFTPVGRGIEFGFRILYLFQWAKANYNFSFALRTDDDVMLCVDHLLWDLPHFPRRDVHYGWLHCQGDGIVYIDEGIVMFSDDLISKFLAQDGAKMLCHPYGDQQIAIWEQELGLNQTQLIRVDNMRIHHSPPASHEARLKSQVGLCDRYIALHGLYKDDMLEFWARRGDGNATKYSAYTDSIVGQHCSHEPFLNWRAMGGMYYQEPKPCRNKPAWNIGGFKVYPGRE